MMDSQPTSRPEAVEPPTGATAGPPAGSLPPTADLLSVPRDAGGQIDQDLPCRSCGYNLRGLPRLGNCPECGQPVMRSENAPSIMSADPAWLRGIERGCGVLLAWIGLNAVLLLMIAAQIKFYWIGFVGLSYTLSAFVMTMLSMLMCWGVWELTRRDASDPADVSQRLIVRPMINVGCAMMILSLWTGEILCFAVPGLIIWVVGYLALLDYVGNLVDRTNDSGLAAQVQRCVNLAVITISLVVFSVILMALLESAGPNSIPAILFYIITIILLLGIFPLNLAAILALLLKLRKRVRFFRQFIACDSFGSDSNRSAGSGGTESANATAGQRDRRG